MKIFHTGDWHIGKVFLNKSFIEEQREVLNKFIERVKCEDPDLIIVAGDIYDKSIPTIEAIELLNEVLGKLVLEMEKRVVMISGNHDSADRLSFGSGILREKGLHIVTDIESSMQPIEFEDEYGTVNIYAIPYISPMKARMVFPEEGIKDHDDIAKAVMTKIKSRWDESARNICVYHGFLTSSGEHLEESESERPLSIGGSDEVSADYFEDFDYVALGHLHGPQKVKYERIRYSGSLMRYSFSEVKQKKGITEVVLGKKADSKAELQYRVDELRPSRDMRILEGTIDQIMAGGQGEANRDDYIMVRIVQDGEVYSPKERLDRIYPNILRIEMKRERKNAEGKDSEAEEIMSQSPTELFKRFYSDVTENELTSDREKVFLRILEDAGGEEE